MDVDAGHGAALGRALPTQSGELPLTRRLRSLLTWPATDDDPVTELVRTHRSIHPAPTPAVLRRAYAIAENMHRGQMRKSGEPYITHPLAVAQICAELGHGHHHPGRRAAARHGGGHQLHARGAARATSAPRWPTWSTG